MTELRKGMRVRAEWLEAAQLGAHSLAGVQMKASATAKSAEGIVTHIRGKGSDPTNPTSIGVWIRTGPRTEVMVDARHIVAVLEGGETP